MKMLGQLLHYLLLHFATFNLLAQGGGKHLSSFPRKSALHFQGNQATKDHVELNKSLFNNATITTTKPLKAFKLQKIQNLRIKDKHDYVPVFVQDSYRTSIPETTELNSTILKVKAKDKHTSLIRYSLSGPDNDYFHMNPLNGVITLAKALEYNLINRYNLSASAKDPMGFSSMVPVLIDIQDMDTMNPHFIFPIYEGSISENKRGRISTHPEEIKAIDGDLGINETVYYSISKVHPTEFMDVVAINRSNGTISLNKEVDRETISRLTVEIRAFQQNNPLKSADSVVMITILDVNDNAPEFSQSIYEAFLPENSPPGSKILVLTASDKDKDGLSNGYFRTNNTMFTVDNNGLMSLIHGKLDRELTPIINVQVWVFDAVSGGLNSSAEVIIEITDINDNNPQFHNLPLHFMIPEGNYTDVSPMLVASLNVTDLDAGLNGKVTITADAENEDKCFLVQKNGNIFVHGPLDREVKDKYVIFLIASDKGSPPRQSFADALVDIEDINDNVPTFTKEEYSVELMLNKVKAGDTIMSVSATDLDIGNNSLISYRFAQPHPGFAINKENGDIFLTSDAFAGNMGTDIVIPVIATDHGIPALLSTATVTVKVSEGPTEFLNSNYSFSLPEGMPEGSDVGSVEVTAGPDVSVIYSVQTYTDVFSITENGTIFTRVILDREEQDSYNIIVTAVDSQDPPNTAVAVVTITVMDVNDNFPVFSILINSNITCQENKNFVDLANISATDLDAGNNSVITYSLENDFNSTFYINSSTGKLMNIRPLDAEKADSYDLKVIAQDSGIPPLSSTTLIHVTVQDVDDNSPIFKRNIYHVTVKENEPPHVILNVSAVDIDTGPNAIILYSFIEVSHLFYIGKESGSISNLKPLDFEERTKHVLTVIAYSPRNHQPQSTATVIVHIEDVNEEGPIVEHPVYHTIIWDGEYSTGSMILDVNAKTAHKNMDEGIHYSISDDNRENIFSVANGTGHIFLTKDLPMHSFPQHYALTVTCTDSGAPPQSTSVKVFVVISPSNVTVPVFSADYYNPEPLQLRTAPDTYLIQIKAFYLPSSLIYSIAEEEAKDYFDMDPMSGIMRTKKHLKMEDFPRNVTVKATDSQRPRIYSEAIVRVTVINGNQYAPVFRNPLEKVTVKEEQSVPTFIAQVQATDKDPGNSFLTYSILNNPPTSFTIDATNGKVFAAMPFDYENGTHEFQVFICADDDGKPHKKQGYLTLIVQVLDINDWEPVFLPHGPMYVEESAAPGTVVGQITATDEDSGDNAFIVYSLSDDDDQFDIDELQGNIFVKRSLDHEAKDKSILTITANNNKTAPFYQTRTNLSIFILDKNDNAPQFTQKIYFVELDVDSPVGSFVTAVNATDRDEGNNGVVEYSLLPDLSSTYFLFENTRDGTIITATNHLKPGKLSLSVVAKDRGSPPFSNMSSVIVNVVNKEKTLPAFEPNEISTVLRKNKPKEEPVFTFSAKNAEGKNVTYRIVAGNDGGQFYLDEKTGKLWTTETFTEDVQPSYNIIVEVDTPPDTQGPLPPNMAELQIIVPDFKEGPVFKKDTYTSTIVNTLPTGFPVIKVMARSRGSVSKPKLIYSLVNKSEEEFDIDKYTGQIVVAKVAGKTGTFNLKVLVRDLNGLSAQSLVQIHVKSPSSSHGVVEIQINQTLDEVNLHLPNIIRVLEDVLQNKVTNISLHSDSSNNTEIKFKVSSESKQDIIRKLTDNLSTIQEKLSSIFEKPIGITIPQPQTFALSQEGIAGIVIFAALLLVVIVSAAIFVARKISQDSIKPSSESIDETHSTSGVDLKNDNGDNMPTIDDDQDGVPKASETGRHEHIAAEEGESKPDNDAPDHPMDQTVPDPQEQTDQTTLQSEDSPESIEQEDVEVTVTYSPEPTDQDTSDSTSKPDNDAPDQQMDQTVPDPQEQTDQTTLQSEDSPESIEQEDVEVTVTYSPEPTDQDTSDSTSKPDNDAPDQQMDQTVPDPQEQTDQTTLQSEDSPESIEQEDVEVTVTYSPEPTDQDTSDSTSKPDNDAPDQQMDQTVPDPQEQTDQTTLQSEDSPESIEQEDVEVTVTYSPEPTDQDTSDSTSKPDNDAPDQQMDQTVPDPQEQTDQTTLQSEDSEPEQSISEVVTVSEEEIPKDGDEQKITDEKQVEYEETWESYESTENSEVDSTKQDETKQAIAESPDSVIVQESKKPESKGREKRTTSVKFLDDE